MYVAVKQLKISEPGIDGKTKVRTIDPGQPVPGVEAWGYPQIVAHLNMQMIRWNGQEMDAPHNIHRKRGVVIPFSGPRAARNAPADKYANSPAEAQPDPITGPDAEAPTTESGPGAVLDQPSDLACPHCERDPFKNGAALKSHIRAKHPEVKKEREPAKAG